MKKKIHGFIAVLLLVLSLSCSKSERENLINKEFSYQFDIQSVGPYAGDIKLLENKYSNLLKSQCYDPDFTNSQIVTYSTIDVAAIFTPLNNELKSGSNHSSLMFFELNNELLDFELIINETILNDKVGRYSYLTVNGQLIVQFDIQLEDGLVLDVYATKSWGDRWNNCVTWTLQNMSNMDYLACMAAGPYCAGGIAAMCAVGASEGYFETPDGP